MWDENKTNARKGKIPIAKARQIARYLYLAGHIAEKYSCQIFISPQMAGLYHEDRMFGEGTGSGVENDWAIIDVGGPFDGGDF